MTFFGLSFSRAAELAALSKSQAIIEFKTDGTILTANENFLKTIGYRLDEIRGKHHSMFVEPAYRDSAEYRDFWQALRRGEYKAAQFKRLAKGGREIWLEASYNPILDRSGHPLKVIKYATDITRQKLDYADLLGKVNAIGRSQAVIEFDLDATILTANENFLKVLGYRLDEIQGRHHSMFVEPGYADSPDYKAFWQALRRGDYQAAQFKRIGKGGRVCWIEASYNPIYDMTGKIYKVVKFATDLSQRKSENLKLADDFESNVKTLAHSVSSSSNDMQATAQSLAAAAEQTNQQSSTVASATEELTASASEIARQLVESTSIINGAVAEAEKSERLVAALVSMADKIGNVSAMIAEIAEQTNLLALNATIEAARAGDAGKGFAVVASEVKALATQTSNATGEISTQIKAIQDSSQETATSIREIVQVINRISAISSSISGAVEEQSAATREVSVNITGVKEAAQDTGRSAATVLSGSQTLSSLADDLNRRVDAFLKNVRAM